MFRTGKDPNDPTMPSDRNWLVDRLDRPGPSTSLPPRAPQVAPPGQVEGLASSRPLVLLAPSLVTLDTYRMSHSLAPTTLACPAPSPLLPSTSLSLLLLLLRRHDYYPRAIIPPWWRTEGVIPRVTVAWEGSAAAREVYVYGAVARRALPRATISYMREDGGLWCPSPCSPPKAGRIATTRDSPAWRNLTGVF